MVTMLRAAPLTTSRKSLFRPTFLAYFYNISKDKMNNFTKELEYVYHLHYTLIFFFWMTSNMERRKYHNWSAWWPDIHMKVSVNNRYYVEENARWKEPSKLSKQMINFIHKRSICACIANRLKGHQITAY